MFWLSQNTQAAEATINNEPRYPGFGASFVASAELRSRVVEALLNANAAEPDATHAGPP